MSTFTDCVGDTYEITPGGGLQVTSPDYPDQDMMVMSRAELPSFIAWLVKAAALRGLEDAEFSAAMGEAFEEIDLEDLE